MSMSTNNSCVFVLSVLVLCSSCPAAVPDDGEWVFVTNFPESAIRGNPGVAVLDGNIYIAGGQSEWRIWHDSLYAYDVDQDQWRHKAPMHDPPRSAFGLAAHNGKLYAIGGSPGYDMRSDVVEEYDPALDTWSPRKPMPTKRAWMGVETIGDSIFVLGGDVVGTGTRNVEKYDLVNDAWWSGAPLPFMLAGMGTATVDGLLYSVAGSSLHVVDTVHGYDPVGNDWTGPISHTPIDVAQHGTTAADDGCIYVAGGWSDTLGGAVDNFWRYTPATGEWTDLPSLPGPASAVDLVWAEGTLYLVDGYAATIHAYVPAPMPGDANVDGVVNDDDLSVVLANWTGAGGSGGSWRTGDFDGDGGVSEDDLSLLLANWRATNAAIPEPATGSLLGMGMLMWLRRERRC